MVKEVRTFFKTIKILSHEKDILLLIDEFFSYQ